MGRLGLLLFLLLPNDEPQGSDYDNAYHSEMYSFADQGLKNAWTSSVIISSYTERGNLSIGSGNYFHIHGHRFILTAAHVVDGFKEFFVTERSGDVHAVQVMHIDNFRDIAILKIPTPLKFTKPIDYRPAKRVQVGKEVSYCGHPNQMYFTSYHGRISGLNNQYLIIDTFAWPGSSGSVIFNKSGRVVGIVSAISVDAPTGFPVLVPHFVRVGPTLDYSRSFILEVLMDAQCEN